MLRVATAFAVSLSLVTAGAAAAQQPVDPDNPTCPQNPNWSTYRTMRFTVEEIDGRRILRAEGQIDEGAAWRLQQALEQALGENDPIDEIWVRSPGGHARVGNEAGRLVRASGIPTRIPQNWACFSACNFLFMGGAIRFVDPGGLFIVHMFTHAGDREAIRAEVAEGADRAIGLIGEIEQDSALLASEDNDFLIRMGISRRLLTEVMYRQKALAEQGEDPSTRRCLTQDEVREYNVANAF